jgi:Domain of unknown function (DUF1977)
VLKDESKRREYDRFGKAETMRGPSPHSYARSVDPFFGGGGEDAFLRAFFGSSAAGLHRRHAAHTHGYRTQHVYTRGRQPGSSGDGFDSFFGSFARASPHRGGAGGARSAYAARGRAPPHVYTWLPSLLFQLFPILALIALTTFAFLLGNSWLGTDTRRWRTSPSPDFAAPRHTSVLGVRYFVGEGVSLSAAEQRAVDNNHVRRLQKRCVEERDELRRLRAQASAILMSAGRRQQLREKISAFRMHACEEVHSIHVRSAAGSGASSEHRSSAAA